jgi:hypothetical protein
MHTLFWWENQEGGRKPSGIHRRWWDNNIKMCRREMELGVIDWIHLAKDRDQWLALVNTVLNL